MDRLGLFSLLATSLLGCVPTTAVLHGKTVQRPTLGYTDGNLFALSHRNAFPEQRGPSSGLHSYGGSLAGRICGVDVFYESEHRGRRLDVSGFVIPAGQIDGESQRPDLLARIEVRDRASRDGGVRDFRGVVGYSSGADLGRSPTVDLSVSPSLLRGRLGQRFFDLHATKDDTYEGQVKISGWTYPFTVKGRSRLWTMPAADQAAILPLMLTCVHIERSDITLPIFVVDFSQGPPSTEPLPLPVGR